MNYPRTVEEVIKDATYPESVMVAMSAFKASKPWRGGERERRDKLRALHADLNTAFGRTTKLSFEPGFKNGCYIPSKDKIIITGEPSVITYLHEYAHALYGRSERKACEWSINLFRQVFPKSYARLQSDGHMLKKGGQ